MQILEEGKTEARGQKQRHTSSTNTCYVQGAVRAVGDTLVKEPASPALKEPTS